MPELNCVLILKGKDGTLGLYYPFTKWRNILDAPDVTGIEVLLNGHIGNSDIHVTAQQTAGYDAAVASLIEHNENTAIHVTAEEKASWTEGAEQAAADANRVTEALNAIAGIESRVSRVEDGLFNNITGNPFLASFDSLDGITLVKGIWNEERKRIEC